MTKVNCTNEDCKNNIKGICSQEEIECFVSMSGDFFCCSYKRKEDGSYDITEEHKEVYPNINYDTNGLEDIKKDAIIVVDYETNGLNTEHDNEKDVREGIEHEKEKEEAVREGIASAIKKGNTSGTVLINNINGGNIYWELKTDEKQIKNKN